MRGALEGSVLLVEARSPLARLRGLAFRRDVPGNVALLIPRCRSVHTFGMRFSLDLVWLDRGGAIVRVDRSVPPRRVRTCRTARSVIEARAGAGGAVIALVSRAE